MIDVATKRFEAAGQNAEIRYCDLFEFHPELPFDVVVANFLLDCFDEQRRPLVVERFHGFLLPGGKVLVADTGIPRGSRFDRAFWRLYHGFAT